MTRAAIVRPAPWARAWGRLREDARSSDGPALVLLVAFLLLIAGSGLIWPTVVPFSAMLLPMFLAAQYLGPRNLPWFVVLSLVGVCALLVVQPQVGARSLVRLAITLIIGLLILLSSFQRSGLGIAGPRGESMLVDLRDRIQRQGVLPDLPRGWYAGSAQRASDGTKFAGDFVVAAMSRDDHWLSVVVVDVSGKGVQAGTRSLLLSGAFGGILTATTPAGFLPAANDFLLRQHWTEGFATAIHLNIDLRSGAYELRKAGHPPAIWLQAGSGRWKVLDSDGPVLGLLDDAEFEVVSGEMAPGDAMLLYTDGMVEDPRRDISSGIDKLAGRGARLVQTGFDGGEQAMIDAVGRPDDDRALLLLHRRPMT